MSVVACFNSCSSGTSFLSPLQRANRKRNRSAVANSRSQTTAPGEPRGGDPQSTPAVQYSAIDQLPADVRDRFDEAFLRYRRAQDAVNQLDKRIQDDPALRYVLDVYAKSKEAESKRNALEGKYIAFLNELRTKSRGGPDAASASGFTRGIWCRHTADLPLINPAVQSDVWGNHANHPTPQR